MLVTCQMGINRSSLVAAMSLMQHEVFDGRVTRLSAQQAVWQIRSTRKPAIGLKPLSNKTFVSALHRLEEMLRPLQSKSEASR